MEALLKAIASGLVEKPEDIVVTSEEQENGTTVYHLHVAEDDMGRVIGKQGRILRVLLRRFDAQPPERDAFLNLRIADFVLPDIAGQLPIRLLPGQKQPNLTARYVVLLRLISRPSNRIKGMFQP